MCIDKYYSIGRCQKVATTREYKGRDGFSAHINLTGFRSIRLFKYRPFGWFAYLSGRTIRFRVSLRDNAVEPIPYEWRLSYKDIRGRFWAKGDDKNSIKGQLKHGQKDEVIDIEFLFDVGQYSLQMRWKDEIVTGAPFQDVLYFSVEDNDVYTTRWMQTLFSGIIGAILGGILGALIALSLT